MFEIVKIKITAHIPILIRRSEMTGDGKMLRYTKYLSVGIPQTLPPLIHALHYMPNLIQLSLDFGEEPLTPLLRGLIGVPSLQLLTIRIRTPDAFVYEPAVLESTLDALLQLAPRLRELQVLDAKTLILLGLNWRYKHSAYHDVALVALETKYFPDVGAAVEVLTCMKGRYKQLCIGGKAPRIPSDLKLVGRGITGVVLLHCRDVSVGRLWRAFAPYVEDLMIHFTLRLEDGLGRGSGLRRLVYCGLEMNYPVDLIHTSPLLSEIYVLVDGANPFYCFECIPATLKLLAIGLRLLIRSSNRPREPPSPDTTAHIHSLLPQDLKLYMSTEGALGTLRTALINLGVQVNDVGNRIDYAILRSGFQRPYTGSSELRTNAFIAPRNSMNQSESIAETFETGLVDARLEFGLRFGKYM